MKGMKGKQRRPASPGESGGGVLLSMRACKAVVVL